MSRVVATEDSAERRRSAAIWIAPLVACLCIGAAISVWLGQDNNWDLRNYHFYLGYSGLTGRDAQDLDVTGAYINPTLDMPYVWLALGPLLHHPRALAAVMGLYYGCLIAVILGLACTLYARWPGTPKWVAITVATFLAATGAATFSQVGTTFNEVQISTLVLAAILILARKLDSNPDNQFPPAALAAGALLGLAAGLKLTAGIYSPATCLALIAVLPLWRWITWCLTIALGWISGFAVAAGWYLYDVYARFGNPSFPLFNGLFRSSWYPPVSLYDLGHLPHSVWQWLFYPVFWARYQSWLVTEVSFCDARMAVTYGLGLVAVSLAVLRFAALRKRRDSATASALPRTHRLLITFLIVGYVLWLRSTSILRYAIPIEVTASLVSPLLLALIFHSLDSFWRRRMWTILTTGIAASLALTTQYPQWGRTAYRDSVMSANMSWIKPNTLAIFAGTTMSYIVPFTPPDRAVSYIGLSPRVLEARGYGLADEVVRRIQEQTGPLVIITDPDDRSRIGVLQEFGLSLINDSCRKFYSSLELSEDRWFTECDVKFEIPRVLSDPFWQQAARRYQEICVPVPTSGWSYVGFVQAAGNAAKGKRYADPFNYLWLQAPDRPKEFDERILPDTLYILNPTFKERALKAMDPAKDVLAEVDGILVLAPGWKNCATCTAPSGEISAVQ